MIGRLLPVLATFAMLFAATPAGAVKSTQKFGPAPKLDSAEDFERPTALQLLREAKELWHVKADYTGALATFNAAVEADPSDTDIRLQRAHFFETLAAIVVPNDKAKFKARAQTDFEHITAADPDSLIAGIARDGLTRLAGGSLIEAKRVKCPKDAADIHAHADALYGARQFADAAVEYEKAANGCPEAATWWVDFADAHYVLKDYERARENFIKALSVDPWNREAHRFLSDTEVQLMNIEAAVQQLVLAVVSDPNYEAGWSALKAYSAAIGGSWNRVYGDRSTGPANPDGASWAAYGAAKAEARRVDRQSASALQIERKAVTTALKSAREAEVIGRKAPGPFWSMMARAEDAGFLDEAIFVHMLDATLAAEYPAFREKNAERLTVYLSTVILR